MIKLFRITMLSIVALLLNACGDLTILQTINTNPSPEKNIFIHQLYMGGGGAAGVTENRLILSENSSIIDEQMPEDAIELLRLGHGCIESAWVDQDHVEVRHCTNRNDAQFDKVMNAYGREIRIEAKYAQSCPSDYISTLRIEKLTEVCEGLNY